MVALPTDFEITIGEVKEVLLVDNSKFELADRVMSFVRNVPDTINVFEAEASVVLALKPGILVVLKVIVGTDNVVAFTVDPVE